MKFLKQNKRDIQRKYYAFISYKRSGKDKEWANRIYRELTNYNLKVYFKGIDEDLVKNEKLNINDKKIKPIFKDTEQLPAGGKLDEKIQQALNNSRKLIVLCSQNMKSYEYWVNLEVEYFLSIGHGAEDVIPLIIEPNIENSTPEKCFPSALPNNWHATSILDYKLAEDEDYFYRLINSFGRIEYRKTILSLIPNLFPTIKRTLSELWEIDKRRIMTKYFINFIFISLSIFILGVLLIWLRYERTRACEIEAMRLVEEARIESNNKNMQCAALLLQHIKKVKSAKFISNFSSFTDNYITLGINDFYNAADTVDEFMVTPLTLVQSKNQKILAGFENSNNTISILNPTNLSAVDTLKINMNLSHIAISDSGNYLFALGIRGGSVVDIRNKEVIFVDNSLNIGQGFRHNSSPFSATTYPYCFSKDEESLFYLSEHFYKVNLKTGKIDSICFDFNYYSPYQFSALHDGNKVVFVTNESVYIIDTDTKKVTTLKSIDKYPIYKAEIDEKDNLMLIQEVSPFQNGITEYSISIIDLKNDIKLLSQRQQIVKKIGDKLGETRVLQNFNACLADGKLVIADNSQIKIYDFNNNDSQKNSEPFQNSYIYNVYGMDDSLMLWTNNGLHIWNKQSKKVISQIKMFPLDNIMPIFDHIFVNDDFIIHTSYSDGSIIYSRNFPNKARWNLENLTGVTYSYCQNYIILVYNYKYVKVLDAKTYTIIKEFISPIFVIGAPQCIKDSDIFVLKCINDFIIYNPVEDDLWMPTQSEYQTDKYTGIQFDNTYGLTFKLYNKSSSCSNYEVPNYPLLIPDKNGQVEIGNYLINIKNRECRQIVGSKINNSHFRSVKKGNEYLFVSNKDTLSFRYQLKESTSATFAINDSKELILATEYQYTWKNYLYNFSGKLLNTFDFISPTIMPFGESFICTDLTKHGIFIIDSDANIANIYDFDAFISFAFMPGKKQILLTGASKRNYIISSTLTGGRIMLPIMGHINTNNLKYSNNGRYLFLNEIYLKGKQTCYNCVLDLWRNSVLLYWPTEYNMPCVFNFIGDDSFFYASYNKQGTIERCIHGRLDTDYLFNWLEDYSKREMSNDELLEYGI